MLTAARTPAYPLPRDHALATPALYDALRRDDPVAEVRGPFGVTAWLITRYADVRTVLTDPRFSRAAMVEHGDSTDPLDVMARDSAGSLLNTDAPEHDRLRRLVTKQMSARQAAAMEPEITRLAARLTERMRAIPDAAQVEFNRDFAHPFALGVVTRLVTDLLGVPEQDREWYSEGWASVLKVADPVPDPARREALSRELNDYFLSLVESRRREPGEDLLSSALQENPHSITDVIGVVTNILFGGYPSVVSALGSCLVTFVSDPVLWQRLRDTPRACEPVIEEVLRLHPAGERGLLRKAIAPVELGGKTIQAGDIVIPAVAAANRDPDHFSDPGALCPGRAGARHLAFGSGTHACLGMALARIELRVALSELSAAFPRMSLACSPDSLTRSHTQMPVNPIMRIPVRLGL